MSQGVGAKATLHLLKASFCRSKVSLGFEEALFKYSKYFEGISFNCFFMTFLIGCENVAHKFRKFCNELSLC
jgi:hypothetical protein